MDKLGTRLNELARHTNETAISKSPVVIYRKHVILSILHDLIETWTIKIPCPWKVFFSIFSEIKSKEELLIPFSF